MQLYQTIEEAHAAVARNKVNANNEHDRIMKVVVPVLWVKNKYTF